MLAHGSTKAAFLTGMVLNLPGLWYLVALNDIAAADYRPAVAVLLIIVFNAIMFLLAEVPLIGYLVRPEQTRIRVSRFQHWLTTHRELVAAVAAAVVGLDLASGVINNVMPASAPDSKSSNTVLPATSNSQGNACCASGASRSPRSHGYLVTLTHSGGTRSPT